MSLLDEDGRPPREIVEEFLRGQVTVLRSHFARHLKEQMAQGPVPLPCETCAFRTNTDDMEGFDRTALGFITALANPAGFFACHMPEKIDGNYFPKPVIDEEGGVLGWVPCAAFAVLKDAPDFDVHDVLGRELIDGLVATYLGCKMPAWAGEGTDDDGSSV